MSVRFMYLSGHLQYNNEEQLVLGLGHDIKTIGDENATNLLVFNVLFKVKIIYSWLSTYLVIKSSRFL